MATNTVFNPRNMNDFEKSKLNKFAIGIKDNATLGSTKNIDYVLTDDVLLAGGTNVLARNVTWGDKVTLQVLDPNGNVLIEFVKDWYLNPDVTLQQTPTSNYPAKLLAGLTLRLIYTSTSIIGTTPSVAINYNFEKILE